MKTLRNNEVLKTVLADSFGGVMYNVANRNKYDAKELLREWDALTDSEKSSFGGCIIGAINFLKEY